MSTYKPSDMNSDVNANGNTNAVSDHAKSAGAPNEDVANKNASLENPKNVKKPAKKAVKKTVPIVRAMKDGAPIVCLTAYTAPMAKMVDAHADVILVGDSLGMVVHGFDSTIEVTLEHMILHGQAVVRGADKALVVVDMPFGSFEESPQQAHRNAARLMKETGCAAVKLEGGVHMADTIRFLTRRGIPVMAHIGLMPQALNTTGGYKVVGRDHAEWEHLIDDAKAVEDSGAFSVVLEGIAEPLAARITKALTIPTIGIGASNKCDGQVLVVDDMLGMFDWTPKFVKKFAHLRDDIDAALANYAAEVRTRQFPAEEHTYTMLEKVSSFTVAS